MTYEVYFNLYCVCGLTQHLQANYIALVMNESLIGTGVQTQATMAIEKNNNTGIDARCDFVLGTADAGYDIA